MKNIYENGIYVKHWKESIDVKISCFICDAPARAYVKQIKGHNAYFGCKRCIQCGEWLSKVTFPQTDAIPRTDNDFIQRNDANHHTETISPLQLLPIGLVSQFVLDPMHLLYLGAMKKLLWLWLKSSISSGVRLGNQMKVKISKLLVSFHSFLPQEFARKWRPLTEYERWKATEFRQFLLYSGCVALKSSISRSIYKHFMLLFVASYCLCSIHLYKTHCTYANELLLLFVTEFEKLYGRNMLVYNVHNLIHLASDVQKFGPLENFSAFETFLFPFESLLGRLKLMLRKPEKPLHQVIRRYGEKMYCCSKLSQENEMWKDIPKGKHEQGPLPFVFKDYEQYTSIRCNNIFFSTKDSDNCVKVHDKVSLIRNILKKDKAIVFLYEPFSNASNFFKYPLDSSDLGIFKVSNLSGCFYTAYFKDITCKFVRFPHKKKFVVIPILHS